MLRSSFRRFHPIPWILVLVGVAAAASVLVARHRVESGNRAVELAIDFVQLRQLSVAMGPSPAQALQRLRAAGVTGTILTEETPLDLMTDGKLFVRERWIEGPGGARTRVTLVEITDPALFARMQQSLAHKLRTRFLSRPTRAGLVLKGPAGEVFLPAQWPDVRGLGIGLNPEQVAIARAAGMDVVARISNFPAAAPRSIDWTLQQVADAGGRVVIFAGEEVLGFRDELKTTASALEGNRLVYGAVEFGKQRGDEGLSYALRSRLVRVHSITAPELARMSPEEAVERFSKGVRERNIRLAYLRLFDQAGEDPLEDNIAYIQSLAADLRGAGFEMGRAQPFPPLTTFPAAHAFAALAVAGAAVLLAAAVVPLSPTRQAGAALLLGAACFGVTLLGHDLGRKVMALGASMLFPTLALAVLPVATEPELDEKLGGGTSAVARFALMSALSVAGGVLVAGIMSQTATLVKVVEFSGIKVAQHAPILFIGALYLAAAFNTGDWEAERRRISTRVRNFLNAPILTWQSVAAVVGLALLVLMVLRSGNDSGLEVSQTELRFRSLLDRFLVRPRTKEFLVGHPLLWCALLFAAWGWRSRLLIPLVLVGVIGQVSMVNSFCHLHTPIALTLARTWNGLWIGTLLGVAVAAAVRAAGRGWHARGALNAGDGATRRRGDGAKRPIPHPVSPSPRRPVVTDPPVDASR